MPKMREGISAEDERDKRERDTEMQRERGVCAIQCEGREISKARMCMVC